MTESEAKKEIEHNVFCNTDNFEMTISKECYKTIIKALEKQIPKKPIKNKSGDSACLCGLIIRKRNKINCLHFCHNCGQAIDWSEEE